MRRFALVAVAIAGLGAGCLGGSSSSSPSPVAATHVEVTSFAELLRACPAGAHCITVPLRAAACPADATCTPPTAGARLIRCPGPARAWIHCFALRAPGSAHRAWLILQQRELWCSPARGGYARPSAACKALADYVRLSRRPGGPPSRPVANDARAAPPRRVKHWGQAPVFQAG